MAKRTLSNAGAAVVIVLALASFYVYQKIQIIRTGYQIRNVEKSLTAIREKNLVLQLNISRLISPERITQEIKKLGLDLIPPKKDQVIRVR